MRREKEEGEILYRVGYAREGVMMTNDMRMRQKMKNI